MGVDSSTSVPSFLEHIFHPLILSWCFSGDVPWCDLPAHQVVLWLFIEYFILGIKYDKSALLAAFVRPHLCPEEGAEGGLEPCVHLPQAPPLPMHHTSRHHQPLPLILNHHKEPRSQDPSPVGPFLGNPLPSSSLLWCACHHLVHKCIAFLYLIYFLSLLPEWKGQEGSTFCLFCSLICSWCSSWMNQWFIYFMCYYNFFFKELPFSGLFVPETLLESLHSWYYLNIHSRIFFVVVKYSTWYEISHFNRC